VEFLAHNHYAGKERRNGRQTGKGQLGAVAASPKTPTVTAEQMEIARLRAENARLKMERDIAKKPQRTLRRMCCKVRLDRANER